MKVLSFDPGETTGYALTVERENQRGIFAGHFQGFSEVRPLILSHKPDIIVIESFHLYPWKAKQKTWSSFPEIEVIGAIKHEALWNSIKWVEQGADTKQLFDDSKLKRLGLWDKLSAHGRDACRHILYYETTRGDLTWVKQMQ